MAPGESSRLLQIQCAHWFLSNSLFIFLKDRTHKVTKGLFWSYREPFKEIILPAESLRQPDKSASLCGNVPEILLFHATSPPPQAQRLIPHVTLFLLLFWTGSSVVLWPRSAERLWQSSQWDQIKVWGLGTLRVNITCGAPTLLHDQPESAKKEADPD